MTTPPPRPCLVCGKASKDGKARCEIHRNQSFHRPASCAVCGRVTPKKYCPEHEPVWTGDLPEAERLVRQPWRIGYRSPVYHRERNAALRRANAQCERCGRKDLKLEVDHIVPLSSAQSTQEIDRLNLRDNLRVLCTMCHRSKKQWDK